MHHDAAVEELQDKKKACHQFEKSQQTQLMTT